MDYTGKCSFQFMLGMVMKCISFCGRFNYFQSLYYYSVKTDNEVGIDLVRHSLSGNDSRTEGL